jgi:hypothetical protein
MWVFLITPYNRLVSLQSETTRHGHKPSFDVGSVTFDYDVGQTGTVFITHFDLWEGSVTFDYNVGQTGWK